MRRVEIRKKIQAPAEKVWEFISDIEKAPDWVVVMQSLVETTDNPVVQGTAYRERSRIGPKESETTWRVTVFEPPEKQVHMCSEADFEAVLTMQVHADDDGAMLLHTTEYALMPSFRPLGWLLEKLFVHNTMKKNLQESVRKCKQLIEENAEYPD